MVSPCGYFLKTINNSLYKTIKTLIIFWKAMMTTKRD